MSHESSDNILLEFDTDLLVQFSPQFDSDLQVDEPYNTFLKVTNYFPT